MIVWTWPARVPGLTIGSARSTTSGAEHGRRKKASTPVKERIAIAAAPLVTRMVKDEEWFECKSVGEIGGLETC